MCIFEEVCFVCNVAHLTTNGLVDSTGLHTCPAVLPLLFLKI